MNMRGTMRRKSNCMQYSYVLCVGLLMVFSSSLLAAEDQQPFVYNDHGKRDPFWSLVSPSGTIITYDTDLLISDLLLEGITLGVDGNNIAIINGRVVKVNDTIGPFVVKQINKESVLVTNGQEQFELTL